MIRVAGPRSVRLALVAASSTVAVTSLAERPAFAQPWLKARSWIESSGPSRIRSRASSSLRVHLRSPRRIGRSESQGSRTVRPSSSAVRLKERAWRLPVATSMWKGIVGRNYRVSAPPGRRGGVDMMRAMPPARPDAVVFDNDGLLLDTESVWSRAEADMFKRYGAKFTLQHKLELVGTSAAIAGRLFERWLDRPGGRAELMEELNDLVV